MVLSNLFYLVAENWLQTLTSYFEPDVHVIWLTGSVCQEESFTVLTVISADNQKQVFKTRKKCYVLLLNVLKQTNSFKQPE